MPVIDPLKTEYYVLLFRKRIVISIEYQHRDYTPVIHKTN